MLVADQTSDSILVVGGSVSSLWRQWWPNETNSWVTAQASPWQERLAQLLRNSVPSKSLSYGIVALDAAGAPVGFCVLDVPRGLVPIRRRVAWISYVFVPPRTRGKGIARRMVSLALERSQQIGAPVVRLATSRWRDEANLYRKLGFRPVEADFVLEWGAHPAGGGENATRSSSFQLAVDDLGFAATVASGSHLLTRQGRTVRSPGGDIEELFSSLCMSGPSTSLGVGGVCLGSPYWARRDSLGEIVAAVPEGDRPLGSSHQVIVDVAQDELVRSERRPVWRPSPVRHD